jgi:O-antigen ligase
VAFKRDKDVTAEDVAESARLRPILAMVAWHMFLDRPIFGCGFGQYEQESPPYLSDRTTDLPLEKARPYIQHNVFLSMLTQTGLLGMGLLVALLACWTRTAWRLWHSAMAPWWVRNMGLLFLAALGVYLPNAMFHDVSIIPMVNMLLFFFGGAVMALTPWLVAPPIAVDLKLWRPEDELAAAAR